MGSLGALALAGCGRSKLMTASRTPPLDTGRLRTELRALSRSLNPARLGVGVMNLESGQMWALRGERRFNLMSVFKAPLAAYALSEVEAGRLSLNERVTIEDTDLSPYSALADGWPLRKDYTFGELLETAVITSDNTAADVLLRRVQGPGALTAWFEAKGLHGIRVDRYEREIQTGMMGMPSFRPAWKGREAFLAARAAVPPADRKAATLKFMADPRDTATPYGMLEFLARLDASELISPANSRYLTALMLQRSTQPRRLAAGLPAGAQLAHKSGTAATDQGLCATTNDVGIITLPDRRSYAVAVFLMGSTEATDARDATIADVARIVVRSLG